MSGTSGVSGNTESNLQRVWERKKDFVTYVIIATMLAVIVGAFGYGYYKTSQVSALTQGYDLDSAFLGGRGWDNSSGLDGVTLTVLKDGQTYRCKHVHFEDLRAGKPIACDNGVQFSKKR